MVRKWRGYFKRIGRFCRKVLVRDNYAKGKASSVYALLFTFALLFTTFVHIPKATSTTSADYQISASPQTLIQQGKAFYDAGEFASSVTVLQQAADAFQAEGDGLRQAVALSNLSLAYQQLGQLSEAQDAIASSLQLLQNASTTDELKVKGAALDVQGQLYLALGQSQPALESFSSAAAAYEQAGDDNAVIRSHINQAQAMQADGLYRRALDSLKEISQTLRSMPDSPLKATGLRSLGNALRLVGNLEDSEKALKESLAVAEQYGEMSSSQDISATLLSLGNTARAKPDVSAALDYYQRAAAASPSLTTKVQAQLNQLSLLVDKGRFPEARALALEIQPAITQLPPNRAAVDARINLAKSLMKLGSSEQAGTDANSTPAAIAQQLSTAAQQAKVIKDLRAESYALGELGTLYEQNKQLSEAQTITEEALLRAQSINAPDIAYRWQWQLGRLLNAQGKTESAITAYDSAVKTLESLRSDLATINPDVQFSFRDSIEPVYRELVGLLLQNKGGETDQKNLRQARELIESLQQAELINFFREDCLNATAVQIDQIDPEAAVIYPIILKDRVAVVLSRPNAELRLYTSPATSEQIDETLKQLLDGITIPRLQLSRKNFLAPSKQLYDWLIKPAEEDLAASQAKTLVFVLDGPLLNLPMAVLNDGEQFLIEKYAIAYTPGLQLLNSNPLERGELTALKAGISEAVQGFEPLPFVEEEFEKIKSTISGELLLNETFTSEAIQQQIDSVSSPVVHLATHGQFSSKAEDTFILTWDKKLDVNQLNTLLRSREESGRGAIELLVLSACETAAGDKRAALGLAGVAVRAGARSTLATLWYVSDAATADIMTLFYGSLSDTTVTKAEALRRAQVELLKDSRYQQPIYWAPYVLVGNWR